MAAVAEEQEREKEEKEEEYQENDEEKDEAEGEERRAGRTCAAALRVGPGSCVRSCAPPGPGALQVRSACHRAGIRTGTQRDSARSSAGLPFVSPSRRGVFWPARAAARTRSPEEAFPWSRDAVGQCGMRECRDQSGWERAVFSKG